MAADDVDLEEEIDVRRRNPASDTEIDTSVEHISDDYEDQKDDIEDIEEDDVDIEVDNNIADHYIAECDRCKGVFITPIEKTDHSIEKIDGQCPLCEHDTTQYLKWVIESVE